jgi:hypothetical protein
MSTKRKKWKEYVKVGNLATVSRPHLSEAFLCTRDRKHCGWLAHGSQGSVAFQNRDDCRETGLWRFYMNPRCGCLFPRSSYLLRLLTHFFFHCKILLYFMFSWFLFLSLLSLFLASCNCLSLSLSIFPSFIFSHFFLHFSYLFYNFIFTFFCTCLSLLLNLFLVLFLSVFFHSLFSCHSFITHILARVVSFIAVHIFVVFLLIPSFIVKFFFLLCFRSLYFFRFSLFLASFYSFLLSLSLFPSFILSHFFLQFPYLFYHFIPLFFSICFIPATLFISCFISFSLLSFSLSCHSFVTHILAEDSGLSLMHTCSTTSTALRQKTVNTLWSKRVAL